MNDAKFYEDAIRDMMEHLRRGDAEAAWNRGCDVLGWARRFAAHETARKLAVAMGTSQPPQDRCGIDGCKLPPNHS